MGSIAIKDQGIGSTSPRDSECGEGTTGTEKQVVVKGKPAGYGRNYLLKLVCILQVILDFLVLLGVWLE